MGLPPIRGRFHTHAQLLLHAGKTKTPFELTQHIFSSVAPPLPSIALQTLQHTCKEHFTAQRHGAQQGA